MLVIHVLNDEIVPFHNGESLYLEVPVEYRAKPLWAEAGHNNIEIECMDDDSFFQAIREFQAEWCLPIAMTVA